MAKKDKGYVNGLTKDEICRLYQFVCTYEYDIKEYPTHFDITSKDIEKLKKECDLYFDTLAKKNFSKAYKYSYYILYEQNKRSKASKDDKAHHLMRHIRNSIAHGRIKKNPGDILIIKDCNNTKDTMEGKISVKLLYRLIDVLIKSRK